MDYYDRGDRVFLLGYSRGAYTVRALAGMLHVCGLLTKGSYNLIPYMAEMYYKERKGVAQDFKDRCSRECPTYLIGVWDTVASVGYIRQKRFSNSVLNPDVRFGYQSLAINERRYFLQPSIWYEDVTHGGQTIEQVWFAGCHGDVGGQDADRGISDIPLEWMLNRAEDCGLVLKTAWQDDLLPDPLANVRASDNGFWRLGAEDRPICEGAKIHRSVFERIETLGDRPAPLPPITLSSPACLYCGVIQEPPPMRRRKCRDCGQVIHVRTEREERKKYLLTDGEAERRAAKDARLARERRNKEWKQLSEQVRVAMQAGDWKSLQAAYQQQARILFVEGRPHRHVAQEATRAQLMSLLELGVAAVKIRTADDERVCAHCQSLDGKVFTIQEALEVMPIPGPNCTDGNEQNPHGGCCRCAYIAVIPGLKE